MTIVYDRTKTVARRHVFPGEAVPLHPEAVGFVGHFDIDALAAYHPTGKGRVERQVLIVRDTSRQTGPSPRSRRRAPSSPPGRRSDGTRPAGLISRSSESGSIVNTMSSSIRVGERRKVAHQAAKSGLVWLTHHAASLTGRQGARCSLLSPGVTITASALATTTEKWRYEALASIRSPHLGWSEDMASMVALLFSNDDAFINVQSFLVDGGAHLSREPGSVTRCHLADFRFVLLSAATRRFHAVATPAGGGSWEPTPKKEPIR